VREQIYSVVEVSYQCVLQSDANVETVYLRFASAPDKSSTKFNSTSRRLASWAARSHHPVCAVGYKCSQSHTRLVLQQGAYCDSMVTAMLDAMRKTVANTLCGAQAPSIADRTSDLHNREHEYVRVCA
jgi:hypothetical protein